MVQRQRIQPTLDSLGVREDLQLKPESFGYYFF